MPAARFSIFSCLCGDKERGSQGLSQNNANVSSLQQQEHRQQFAGRSCSIPSAYHEETTSPTDVEARALLQLQRLLGGLRGTWLPKTHDVLSSIAVFFNAANISFYVAAGSGTGDTPTSFVLVARELSAGERYNDDDGSPVPGFEVWPANARAKLCGNGPVQQFSSYQVTSLGLQQETGQQLMPAMLDRMLASQTPIIERLATCSSARARGLVDPRVTKEGPGDAVAAQPKDGAQDLVALVPLNVGDRIAGALWIARYGCTTARLPNGKPPHPAVPMTSASKAQLACGGVDAAAAPPQPQPPLLSCPALLSNPLALQQLSLSASLCLLGSDTAPFMAALCDSLRQLAAAGSMQQLVGGLCDALGGHMRERFLMEPRVFAALVPEPASTVGLMFNWPAPTTATPATPLQPQSRSAPRIPRGGSVALPYLTAGGGGGGVGESASPTMPRFVVPLGVKDSQAFHRSQSDSISPCVARHAPVVPPGGGGGSHFQDREGGIAAARFLRGIGTPQRVAVVAQAACLDSTIIQPSASGGAAIASGSFTALRVKPFPLVQTLLRHVVRGFASEPDGGLCARALEVADCVLHVQDPRKPSRDILFLIASSGVGSAPSLLGQAPGVGVGAGCGAASTGGLGGLAAAAACGGSFSSSRRPVGSLLLLVLPAGDGKALLGLYVTFPQQLPKQLLRQAKTNLLEILEVVAPMVARKLTNDLAVELETLATAAPGSYAVLEGFDAPSYHSALATGVYDSGYAAAAALRASETKLFLNTGDGDASQTERVVPIYSTLDQSFLFESRNGGGGVGTGGGPAGAPSSSGAQGGGIAGCVSAHGATRSMNLIDASAGPHVAGAEGDQIVGMTSLLSANDSALPPVGTGCGEAFTRSTVIHLEEMDMAQSTLRAQMPLLVASMQNSISNARLEAAVAAAAACMNRPDGPTCVGSSLPSCPFGSDPGDLAQLELHSQLGHGGCAVVFKGKLGTLDCAIKLMEMPDVDEVETATSKAGNEGLKTEGVGGEIRGGADDGQGADCKDASEGDSGTGLAARRALLRNAMELAAMTSISHPNIMQVYSTFSNVTVGRRAQPDGTDRFFLKSVDGSAVDTRPDAPPICVAIVCEWCDRGCLSTALHKKTFPHVLPASGGAMGITASSLTGNGSCSKRPVSQGSGGASGGGSTGRYGRNLDYKGILMTLLDVAMALRHLHAHQLVHRDIKPANVLLKSNAMDPRGFTAKLADFGFVTLMNQPGDEKSGGEPYAWLDETCGTVTHMAPECFEKPARLDASSDVFSFGILMWEMTGGGVRPYPEVHPNNVSKAVKRGLRPVFEDGVPVQYKFLAQRCWTADPLSRPRTPELVALISQMLSRM